MARITCGHCKATHTSVAEVRACREVELDIRSEQDAENAWLRSSEAPTDESIRDLAEHDASMANCWSGRMGAGHLYCSH